MQNTNIHIKLVLYPKLHFAVYLTKLLILILILYNMYTIVVYSNNNNDDISDEIKEVVDNMKKHDSVETSASSSPLILLWNNYQETGSHVYKTIFHKITSGGCRATCRVTMDKSRQNQSSAIVFHMPDLHWEGYNFPQYRDPQQPWILMTYESGNSIRQRSFYKGRYPVFDGKELAGVINRTMTVREDSDIVIRYGVTKIVLKLLERGDLPVCFEYRTASEE